ncbi:23018_t:CDS:1, partial [Gigaspora margarita]
RQVKFKMELHLLASVCYKQNIAEVCKLVIEAESQSLGFFPAKR